jgi:hypothetical protein
MSIPEQIGLILHPERPDVPKEDLALVPLYAVTNEGGVGEQNDTIPVMSLGLYDLVASQWAFLSDGRAFIACQSFGETKYWIERALLAEATYSFTTAKIDLKAAEIEGVYLAEFWDKERTKLLERKQVTVEHQMLGAIPGGTIDVLPGTYDIVRLMNKRLLNNQLCPFSLIILVNGARVAIVPDILWGIADESAVEAEAKGLAVTVSAEEVRDAFASAPKPLLDYVPVKEIWLTDNQMHYVSPEWMGVVCVLERMPTGQDEVTNVANVKQQQVQNYMTNAGVRFGTDIFIQDSYRGTGVEYHEAMHKLSHRAMRDVLGAMFNEGVTEYFTWKVIDGLIKKGVVIRDESQYGSQRTAVAKLLEHGVTEAELAEAYFKGRLQPLFDRFSMMTKGSLSLDGYAARLLSSNKAHAAIQVLGAAVGT